MANFVAKMSSKGKSTRKNHNDSSPIPGLEQTLQTILERLNSLEDSRQRSSSADNGATSRATSAPPPPDPVEQLLPPSAPTAGEPSDALLPALSVAESCAASIDISVPCSSVVNSNTTATEVVMSEVTEKLVSAISAIPVRSNHVFISNFDPSLHDFDAWCSEVDHVRSLNRWDDRECLARIGNCLKGDAKVWLNEWISNDRSWSNFKREFKSLCPLNIDIANILFDVMKTDSDNYSTYAEYARRSLLRLRIVKGMSDELIAAIVIRGITDAQIRASATNAKLLPDGLVNFLSTYTKPAQVTSVRARGSFRKHESQSSSRKRQHADASVKCFSCGGYGHKQVSCTSTKRIRSDVPSPSTSKPPRSEPCSFCKKIGHKIDDCFAKQRADSRGKSNVNFCRETVDTYKENDIATAVIQGVPVDVLIDSGSTISLISESVAKHLQCTQTPSFRVLRGIGSQEVHTSYCTTLSVEFFEITLEVDFHVVPDKYMNTPVIIGTDVLNRDGVIYTRTRGVQRLTRAENVCKVLSDPCIPINTPLVGQDRERLMSVIDEFAEYLVVGTATTTVQTGTMHIRLHNETPVVYRPYKMSHDEKLRVRNIIQDLLDKNIIRESESEFASPVLLVKKKDGSDRLCVDFRALNANTIKDHYPLPLIDDHIDRLGKAKYFTSLDMATGFHQIKLDSESVHRTGFVTPEGHWEYIKMPYGLANSPVVYQRIISNTLRSYIDAGRACVYIDDVLLPSDTIEEGLQTLREVLGTLTKAGFSINLKKCKFLTTEVEYLGRTISNGQVRPSKYKVEALVAARVPSSVKEVRQFLGLAGYFRRYIPGYSSKTACIANLTRKGVQFRWGEEQEEVRRDIIERLTSEPVLAIFDPSLPTEVHTDASALGYGAVLLQTHDGGHKQPVAYFSKVTQGAEPRYHSYELETLAVVKALQHFRHYLIGTKFKVVTDCNALKLTQRKKDLLPRVARWWMYLQDYDFDLEYRKGTALSHADYLSRNPVNICEIRKPLNWAQIAQAADEETQTLLQKHKDGELDSSRYIVRNDVLYYKMDVVGEQSRFLCYVPKGHRLSLLRVFHDEHQHIGIDKTTDLVLKHFWFPKLRQFVRKYIQHCVVCLSHKKVPCQPSQPIESWIKPTAPFETVHSDVLGPLPESNGFKYVVLIVDAFTKYCLLYPIRKQDANELKHIFESAISLFGCPKLLVADRGRMYESASFVNWVKEMGCDIHFITPEMHRSNGQVERYCRTVMNMIRVESNFRQERWSDILWKLQLTLNMTTQKSTKCSPINLLTGNEGVTPVIRSLVRDVALEATSPNRESLRELARQRASELLDENRTRQDARVNERRKAPRTFNKGDMVFVRKTSQATGKLDSGMRGPYVVTQVLPHGRYELKLIAGSYGKTTQAAAEYITLWRGEWTPEVCIAFFESEYALV